MGVFEGHAADDALVWISLKEIEEQKKKATKTQLRKDAEDAKERQRQMRLDAGLQPVE